MTILFKDTFTEASPVYVPDHTPDTGTGWVFRDNDGTTFPVGDYTAWARAHAGKLVEGEFNPTYGEINNLSPDGTFPDEGLYMEVDYLFIPISDVYTQWFLYLAYDIDYQLTLGGEFGHTTGGGIFMNGYVPSDFTGVYDLVDIEPPGASLGVPVTGTLRVEWRKPGDGTAEMVIYHNDDEIGNFTDPTFRQFNYSLFGNVINSSLTLTRYEIGTLGAAPFIPFWMEHVGTEELP